MSPAVSSRLPPQGQRITTPSAQRRAVPKSPHFSRVNSIRKEPIPVAAVKAPISGGSSTLPRSPKSSRQQRKQQMQALHDENEKLCDSVQETYMVRLSVTVFLSPKIELFAVR